MNGKGLQILIEAVLVLIAEVMTWTSNRSKTKDKSSDEKASQDNVSQD